jgi:uncharacterized protein YndB with AHSA1/START domain
VDARNESERGNNGTDAKRVSDRELVVTRMFDAPARLVFEAWTKPELFRQWWMPKSCGIPFLTCEIDARTGGTYRMEFGVPGSDQPTAFYGRYLEVIPGAKLVWTNEEGGEGGAVTTVTFEEQGEKTRVVLRDLYPSKQALDEAIESGSSSGYPEQFTQLDELLAS